MPTLTLDPGALDAAAARLYDTAAWQRIVEGWHLTAPEPAPRPAATEATHTGSLVTKTVEQLVAEALAQIPVAAPAERPLPGRLAAVLPDRLQAWRRVGQVDLKPSVQLDYAAQILREWGWQNQPYKLRDVRGARCICGALLTAHRLGYGSFDTMNRSGAWVVTELRTRGWTDLIGPWNRAPGRTVDQALELLAVAARRAAHSGH